MADDEPTLPLPDGSALTPEPSELRGLTEALGLDPVQFDRDSLIGSDIGGVTIEQLIGEGGMGRVYKGKQEKPSRTVAVKIMRPGLLSPTFLKRFEYEAEVLARLQHPGIAHIYSVGCHRVGNASVPYFVMEYIADAKPLTDYATSLKLSTRQRLDLFRSVCDAVAHGHQKGVIHRDLKPSNILVDATGQPKVIDFGIARVTDSDMALTTMLTDMGDMIGTLQYMSPEQFDANPHDIDVRSDVYALGVVLYQLLAEKLPYDVREKAIYEAMRIVKEDDPPPLSAVKKSLKGDVAVIAGKCLEKERSRRYAGANELNADIGRYLSGDAIMARPPAIWDVVLRLAKKHRFKAAVALACLGVVGAGSLASLFAHRAEKARARAVAAHRTAESTMADLQRQRRQTEAVSALADKAKAEADAQRTAAGQQRTEAERQRRAAQRREKELEVAMKNLEILQSLIANRGKEWAALKQSIDVVNKVSELPPMLAKRIVTELNGLQADLLLNGLQDLSPESAEILARYSGDLHLLGLRTLSDDAARALAQHRGTVFLSSAIALSDQAATEMRPRVFFMETKKNRVGASD